MKWQEEKNLEWYPIWSTARHEMRGKKRTKCYKVKTLYTQWYMMNELHISPLLIDSLTSI